MKFIFKKSRKNRKYIIWSLVVTKQFVCGLEYRMCCEKENLNGSPFHRYFWLEINMNPLTYQYTVKVKVHTSPFGLSYMAHSRQRNHVVYSILFYLQKTPRGVNTPDVYSFASCFQMLYLNRLSLFSYISTEPAQWIYFSRRQQILWLRFLK